MPTKATFLLALMMAFWAIISFSSCEEICDIPPETLSRTKWELIEIDNSDTEPKMINNNRVSKEAFGLEIQYYSEKYYFIKSCPDHYYSYADSVVEVFIYVAQDFDQTHAAGAMLNDYFKVRNLSRQTNLPFYKPVSESIAAFNISSNTGIDKTGLILAHAPEHPGDFQFKVKLKLTSSDTIILKSRLITLY